MMVGLFLWRFTFIAQNHGPEYLEPWRHGLRLDLSVACGTFLLVFIPWVLYLGTGKDVFKSLIKLLLAVAWVFICLTEYSSALLYAEWGTTTDYRSFSYLSYKSEAWASVYKFIPLWYTLFSIVLLAAGFRVLKTMLIGWSPVATYKLQSWSFVLVAPILAFLGLRGGWQKIPIHASDAFYSDKMVNNFAATNKEWYFLSSLAKSGSLEIYNSSVDIDNYRKSYIKSTLSSVYTDTLTWKDRNIVVIMTEGWSADMVEYLGGSHRATPFFDSLSRHSCRFTNAFSSGFRTDQGIVSAVYGVPSVRGHNLAEKMAPNSGFKSLPLAVSKKGYTSLFTYGGDLNFASLGTMVRLAGFDIVAGSQDFPAEARQTSWGVPDHLVLEQVAKQQKLAKKPFLSVVMLLSSHAPFDLPNEDADNLPQDIPALYRRSVSYSDKSLEQYFTAVKTEPWYGNTVFVITSDHGNTHSGWADPHDEKRFRIPLIIYTPDTTLNLTQREITEPCNHFDLAGTLARKTGADSGNFVFSRDIFDGDTNRRAYWSTDIKTGFFSLQSAGLEDIGKTKTDNSLFLDMVSVWFQKMTEEH